MSSEKATRYVIIVVAVFVVLAAGALLWILGSARGGSRTGETDSAVLAAADRLYENVSFTADGRKYYLDALYVNPVAREGGGPVYAVGAGAAIEPGGAPVFEFQTYVLAEAAEDGFFIVNEPSIDSRGSWLWNLCRRFAAKYRFESGSAAALSDSLSVCDEGTAVFGRRCEALSGGEVGYSFVFDDGSRAEARVSVSPGGPFDVFITIFEA